MSQPSPVGDPSLDEPAGDDAALLTVEVTEEAPGTFVAYVRGEIDMATCERLRDAIEPHLGPGQRIVMDLSGVSFMDSSCLNILLHARTTLTADGGSLILRNPSKAARLLLSLTGISELFDIELAAET
jgi:anti-sigma B factor antagonist